MASAMVLAAGLGTRLRPLTDECPKPLVPVGDRPLLAHVIESLRAWGHRELVVNTHHLPQRFDGFHVDGVEVHWSHEPQILGSAGGVRAALPRLEPPVVVRNGDIWGLTAPPGLLPEIAAGASVCLLVAPVTGSRGTVGLDSRGNVVRLRTESFGDEHLAADYVGTMALGTAALERLPERGCLIGDVCLPLLRAGARVATTWCHEDWCDVGSIAGYLQANRRWLAGRELESFEGPDSRVDQNVELQGSVLGARVHLHGHGLVRNCVLWENASAAAPLQNTVVTSGGRRLSLERS